MNKSIRLVGFITVIASLASAWGGYELAPGYWQSILTGLATTFFGLGLAVIVVNHFLSSSDKKLAAKPVLKLIAPNVQELHNELFIRHLHNCFGKDQFEALIDIYKKHKGNPKAFSPQQRDDIYQAIEQKKTDLLRVHDALQEQLKELSLLLGWSFDSKITAAALTARLNYATFRAVNWDGSEQTKLAAIESYIDSEAATSGVLTLLIKHLGLKDSEWKSES